MSTAAPRSGPEFELAVPPSGQHPAQHAVAFDHVVPQRGERVHYDEGEQRVREQFAP